MKYLNTYQENEKEKTNSIAEESCPSDARV